jgi:micrococcal nuclease
MLYHYKGRVMKVVDGDTIDVEIDLGFGIKRLERVRLAGIDTPELRDRDEINRQNAKLATDFVVSWVKMNGDILLSTVKDNDKYGRYLAYVSSQSSGEVLNDILLKSELAVKYID